MRGEQGRLSPRTTAKSALATKAWFSYVGKIPDDGEFLLLSAIPDFADISDNRQKSIPDSREKPCLFVIGGLEPSNVGDW